MRSKGGSTGDILLLVMESNPILARVLSGAVRPGVRFMPLERWDARQVRRLLPDGARRLVFVADAGSLRTPTAAILGAVSAEFPNSKRLVLDAEFSPARLYALLARGVHGFLEYRTVEEELGKAVAAVAAGHLWMRQEQLEQVCLRLQQTMAGGRQRRRGLTLRERDVVDLARKGLSNKEIADQLGITISTAKFHLARALPKVGARSRHEIPVGL